MEYSICAAAEERLEGFVNQGVTVESTEPGEHVSALFHSIPDLEGVVVVRDAFPIGLIMRTHFFQKLGTPYGHSLYTKRPVSILMESDIASVDCNDSIEEVGRLVTLRNQNNLYDYIIVVRENRYWGVISIRQFLIELSERNRRQVVALQLQNEKELRLRTILEEKTQSVTNLLDHAGQGFLSFGRNFIVHGEYSAECKSIFGKEIGGHSYLDVICPYYPPEKRDVFEAILAQYFVNTDSHTDTVYLSLFPTEAQIDGKSILLEYKRIEDTQEKKVMVILTDISEKKQMEMELEQDRENQRLVIKAIKCKSDICQMLREFREANADGFGFYERKGSLREFLASLFRLIHTFKGDFAQCSFHNTTRTLHRLESRIDDLLKSNELREEEVAALLREMRDTDYFSRDIEIAEGALGASFFDTGRAVIVTEDRFCQVLGEISSCVAEEEREAVAAAYKKLGYKSLPAILLEYRDYISYLAGRIGKCEPDFTVTGDDIYVDEETYGPVLKTLVHIFRNALDHGLETEEERVVLGKCPTGSISCHVIDRGDAFLITIRDDGRGIDFEKLKVKAVEKGLCGAGEIDSMSEEAQQDLIFMDSLSTKDAVSQLSGRGVGMSSVRQACRILGGNISVQTEQLIGTTFTITLPYQSRQNGGI